MAVVTVRRKGCTVNPLKLSQPLGAALAFLGLEGAMPLFHGARGCTSFGLVTFVKHFRESIPFQTTALDEVTTILGGRDNLEQAILNIRARAGAKVIGVCTTGLTEIRGEDVAGDLRLIRRDHPELERVPIIPVATPDFTGAFQDGWAKAAVAMIEEFATPAACRDPTQVNILPGSHLTAGDIEEVRTLAGSFGLRPVVLPDISGSLDGHMPAEFRPVALGGTTLAEAHSLGAAAATLALGEQMRPAAETLETRTAVPFHVLDRLTGLAAADRLIDLLARLSGRPVPEHLRRQRSQLVDAMLDGHFFFGDARVAVAGDPDLVWTHASWLAEMGCKIVTCVVTTASLLNERMPVTEVVVGDLDDLAAGAEGCALIVANSHARHAAGPTGASLFRVGYPVFDRLGSQHLVTVGYRGTRDLIFAVGNLLIERSREPAPDTWRLPDGHLPEESHDRAQVQAH